MIDAFAVAGTPEECAEKCLRFMKHGITQLVFASPYGPKPQESLKMVCEEIISPVLTDVSTEN